MIPEIRERFNQSFTKEKYQQFLDHIANRFGHRPLFRIAETPVFFPDDFKEKVFAACSDISDTICRKDFKELTKNAIPDGKSVPNEDEKSLFIQMDFGVCRNAATGEIEPQLIEVQGFPSLYLYQELLAESYEKFFEIPSNFSHLFGGLNAYTYRDVMRDAIVGNCDPENVILLEVAPHKQTTQIDFWCTQGILGIKVLCVSELIVKGDKIFYKNEAGTLVPVHRIYNRVIFDELDKKPEFASLFDFSRSYDVEWVGHPNWFFRISKYTMPFLNSPYVPQTVFLSDVQELPKDLEHFVLKPLYSFAGSGVIIHVTKAAIEAIPKAERHNYILQRKVDYVPIVKTPDVPSKCEVRMLMLWPPQDERPRILTSLTRLSKGEMVGVRYNKDKEWVGGSIGYFKG
jgi:hypothetical protein